MISNATGVTAKQPFNCRVHLLNDNQLPTRLLLLTCRVTTRYLLSTALQTW